MDKVFAKFSGKHTLDDGSKRSYWIQLATEEYREEIIDNMCSRFLLDEPLCRYANIIECKESVASMRNFFGEVFNRGAVLLCLTEEKGRKKIAGLNMTYPTKENDHVEVSGDKAIKVVQIVDYVTKKRNVWKLLHIDTYLSAMGLLVLPEYRGEGIGLELLKAREPLCRSLGIKASCTVFTSIFSQIIAEKAGFRNFYEISYDELFEQEPHLYVEKIQEHTKSCRFMYIQYK